MADRAMDHCLNFRGTKLQQRWRRVRKMAKQTLSQESLFHRDTSQFSRLDEIFRSMHNGMDKPILSEDTLLTLIGMNSYKCTRNLRS